MLHVPSFSLTYPVILPISILYQPFSLPRQGSPMLFANDRVSITSALSSGCDRTRILGASTPILGKTLPCLLFRPYPYLNRLPIDFMMAEPTLRSTPAFVVGMPVAFVNSRFTFVTPSALFQEKLSPGTFVLLISIYLSYLR